MEFYDLLQIGEFVLRNTVIRRQVYFGLYPKLCFAVR